MSADSKIIPQNKSAPLSPGVLAGVLLGAIALGVCALVFFFNPSTHGFYPVCLFHALTGLNCPGCGMTRALHGLLHGHLMLAMKDNALFVVVIGLLASRGLWFASNKRRGRANGDFFPAKFLWLLLVTALAFAVLRNLPAFSFLSP